MRHISEVLRLAAQGLSQREISTSVGISRTSVRNYLARATRAGLSWPLAEQLDAAAIEARLFKRTDEGVRSDRPEPDWLEVHREHKRGKHVTLQLLRLEYAAGERMFVDFAGDTVPVIDAESGRTWQTHVFVSVLGASGYLYAEATRGEDLASWLGAHVRALEFYSGSPKVAVPDNLKSGVTKACWYEPGLNASYLELARTYSMAILPARPYRPRDKTAEVGVLATERRVLAPLRKRQFFSLAELNAAIAEQVALVNDRPFRGQTISRQQLFEELERPALQPLPATPYEFALWKSATVNLDYHVEFDTRLYSVPHRLVHEPVEVRATATTVEVFHRGRRITSHAREYGRKRFITKPEHMPASHRAHLEWTPSKLIAWGRSVGPPVGELVERILNTRPHPESMATERGWASNACSSATVPNAWRRPASGPWRLAASRTPASTRS